MAICPACNCEQTWHWSRVHVTLGDITTSPPHRLPQPILAPHRLRQLIDQLHRLDAHRDHLADEVGNVSLIIDTVRIALNAASNLARALVTVVCNSRCNKTSHSRTL